MVFYILTAMVFYILTVKRLHVDVYSVYRDWSIGNF